MHQIAPFLSFFSGGGGQFFIVRCFFIKTLMGVDQIYSYLLKLEFNLRIGPNSNYKKTFYGYKNRSFHFV